MRWPQSCLDAITAAERRGQVVEQGRPSAAPIAERVSERDFMAEVIRFAKSRGWKCYHAFDSRRSESGWPDLVMTKGAKLICAELKVPPNKPTAAQLSWLEALADTGAKTFVWYPTDWPAISDVLK